MRGAARRSTLKQEIDKHGAGTMFKKILVSTDGSDGAMHAIEAACDLANKFDAELAILHVMEEIGSSRVPEGAEWLAKVENIHISEADALRTVAEKVVAVATTRAHELGVSKATSEIRAGHAADTINEYAKQHGADLIVMGRRGLGRVSDLLLGSVSHRVSQLCDCACLTIK
jgi:nucleotide-binding universal stress UspA family protein